MPKGIINVQANQVTLKKITFKPETSSKPLKIALMHHKLSHKAYHVKIVSFASWRWIFLIAHTFISSHTHLNPKRPKYPSNLKKPQNPFPSSLFDPSSSSNTILRSQPQQTQNFRPSSSVVRPRRHRWCEPPPPQYQTFVSIRVNNNIVLVSDRGTFELLFSIVQLHGSITSVCIN